MKRFKKIIRNIGIIIILLILFRGFLYRVFVNYSKVSSRNKITLTDKNLITELDAQLGGKILSIKEIISLSNKMTSKKLSFTFQKVPSNPNKISELQTANCIGYSSMFNSIGNYLITKQHQNDTYEFNHFVGEIDVLGFNIHNLFNSPFFKDHDFNEIKNSQTGEKIFVDPSLRDYIRIEHVTSQ